MSLTDKIKNFLSSDALLTKKQEEQKKEQLAQKAFSSSSGTNRDTGKHSNSVTPTTKTQKTTALSTSNNTGVKQPKKTDKGIATTKVSSDNFNNTNKTANQNRYVTLKQGAGLYTDDDMGFSGLKAGSVRMSDSQKGNNNSKPQTTLDVIKMANIQSKHMDKTVQNTINAHNASTVKKRAKEDLLKATSKIAKNIPTVENTADKVLDSMGKASEKQLTSILSGLKNPNTYNQTLEKLDKYGKESFGNENSPVLDVNPVSKSLVPRTDKAADRDNALADAWNDTKKSDTHREPITVQAVNGKAPKGLYPGDKVVTNAGTYTIKAMLSDGSYITDATSTYKDSQGKIWEKAPDTTQTKYNTYNYDNPTAERKVEYNKNGLATHIKDTASKLLNDDSKAEEYRQKQTDTYNKAEKDYWDDKKRATYLTKDHGLLAYMKPGTESDWNSDMGLLSTATQNQKNIYNYTYAKYGKEAANEYLEALKYTTLNPKQAKKTQQYIETDAKENPVVSSIASVASNTVLPQAAAIRNAIQGAKNVTGLGKYKPIDQNDSFNLISNYGSQVRGKVSESIKNPALRIGYNAAMSIADMAAQTLLLGQAGSKFVTLSMSTVSANDTVLDTLSRGGSQQQAFLNGFINGALEYVSESPAVEGVFSAMRGGKAIKDTKSFALAILKQMGAEGLGEGFANVSQNLADQIIMGNKSNFGLTVQQYEQQGLSHKEATKQAALDMYFKQTAEAMATGALAGGVMGGAVTKINAESTGRNIKANTDYAKDLANTAEEIGLEGKYAETAEDLAKGNPVRATDAANLKGAIQDYYIRKAGNDISEIYQYVGLEKPNRLSTAFGKASNRDETGFQNKKFTDAWIQKSADIVWKTEQYKATKTPELESEISEYLDYANILLYSGSLSQEGQISAAARAKANEAINGISASAAGDNIVSNDSSLYEDTDNTSNVDNVDNNVDNSTNTEGTQNENGTVNTQSDTLSDTSDTNLDTSDTDIDLQGDIQDTTPTATNITEDAVPLSEGVASVQSETVPTTSAEGTKTTVVHTNSAVGRNINTFTFGKKRGSTVTYHKSAAQKNGSVNARTAAAVLDNQNYDLIEENPKTNTVTFIYTYKFDSATEPAVTKKVRVKLRANGNATVTELKIPDGEIIVDKSEYVPSNYTGFDVAKQKARESAWKNSGIVYDSSRLNNKNYFNQTFNSVISTPTVTKKEQTKKKTSTNKADKKPNQQTEDNADQSNTVQNTDRKSEEKTIETSGYRIDESSDGKTFTVYDPEGYYEDEFKTRKEAEKYIRNIINNDDDSASELETETETEDENDVSESEKTTETEENEDNVSDDDEEVENNASESEDDAPTSETETETESDTDTLNFGGVEYEFLDWDEFDSTADTEPVEDEMQIPEPKKIDIEKLRSNRAIAKDVKSAFRRLYETPKSASEMNYLVKQVYNNTVETGYYDFAETMDLFAGTMERKYAGEDVRSAEEKEYYQYITHTDFKVDDKIKAEIPDYGIWQKANKNLILKASAKGTMDIDSAYEELDEAFPTVFAEYLDAEATHPGDQFKKMVAAARKIQEKMYVTEGDVGTELEGLDMDTISYLWADEMSKALSIAKPEKKASATKKTVKSTTKTEGKKNESKDKQRADEKVAGSKTAEKGIRKNGSKSDGNSTESNQKGHSESSDAVNKRKVSTGQPTELKARGRKKQNAQPPNKDNPLQGSLHNITPKKNYGKTDAAINNITEGNRATAENIGSIIKDIGKTFKVNIYAKRFRNRGNTLGWFNNTHNEIHTQEQEQLGVAIHELGHKIDSETKLNESQSVQDMLDGIPGLREELKQRGYSENEMKFEVMADFIWKYLSEPDTAYEMGSYARSGNFYNTFETVLKNRKLLKDVQRTRGNVLAFTTKDTTERIRGQVRTREEVRAEDRVHINDLKTPQKLTGKIANNINTAFGNFQENWVDSTWAASQVVKKAEKASGRKLTPQENLQLALEFAGSNASVTDTIISRALIKPNGEVTEHGSFVDIINQTEKQGKKLTGESRTKVFNDFSLYLLARHSIDRENLGQVTMSHDATGGNNIAAYEQLIRQMDKRYGDLFEKQSDAVYEWYDNFMQEWMVNTGLMTQVEYNTMHKMYPHYVPMFRVMDMRHTGNGGVSKGVNPIKHNSFNGSSREVYNPIENIMIQVNNIVQTYYRNEVGRTIDRLYTSSDAEIQSTISSFVTLDEEPLIKQEVHTEEKKDKLQKEIFHRIYNDEWSATERGAFSRMSVEEQSAVIDKVTNKDLMDSIIEDTLTEYIPAGYSKDDTTIVTKMPDGSKKFYKIRDANLAKAILASPPSNEILLHIGKVTRVFTALTTSQNPIFALSNAIRDFQHGWVYIDADKWYQNFTYPVEWAVALAQSFKNEFSKNKSERYIQYKSTTGFDNKYMSDADTLGSVMAQVRMTKNGFVWATRFLERLNGAIESAPRYLAFKRKYNSTGGDVMVAGKAGREATVNFNRKGRATRQVGQLVPFMGAAIAGVDQFTTLATSKETYTTKKGLEKLARAMVTQALPAILLAFMNTGWFGDDDEKKKEYDELSEYTKNNYWVFKVGDTWIKLPRDREISAFFGTNFQQIVLDSIYPDERDSTTTKEFIGYLKEQMIPSLSPVGWALIQAKNNKTWYGSSIVSTANDDLLKSTKTYMEVTDESTSEIAEWLAGIINKGPETMREWLGVLATPKGVDYALEQLFGGAADVILPLTTPTERWAGLGASLVAKYTFNQDKSSRYTTEAYDIKDELTALNAAGRLTDEETAWLATIKNTMSKSSGDNPDYKTVGDYFADIREYKNDVSMSYKERTEKINEAYEHIADMTYNLVRAYKDGGAIKNSYGEKIIPSDIDTVGLTAETYTDAFNRLAVGDESAEKLAIATDTTLNDKQKEYMSKDIIGKSYENYADAYKKMSAAGVTAEQITKAYNSTAGKYNADKARALAITAAGGEHASLIATAVAGTSSDKFDSTVKLYENAVAAGVTPEMYDSIMNLALEISQASGKKGITKAGFLSACKKVGCTGSQTAYVKQLYNSRWK